MKLKTCRTCDNNKYIIDFYKGHLDCKVCILSKKKLKRKTKILFVGHDSKECGKCLTIKPHSDFGKHLSHKDKMTSRCKSCINISAKTNYIKHKKTILATNKRYRKNNKDKFKVYRKKWKDKNKKYANEWSKNQRMTNIQFKIAQNIRSRMRHAMKSNQKAGSAIIELGLPISEVKLYLESKFRPGMSWDNYGPHGWHIDHIKPLIKFDLTDLGQFKEACHFKNLQPLWAKDNLSKGSKYEISA